MELTKNFKLEEFTKSETATQKGIDNTPSKDILENIKYMAEQLQIIRNSYKMPINISSGYRCEDLNQAVKGSKTSQHKQGLAVDINQGSRTRNHNLFKLVRNMMKIGLPVQQLIDEYDYSWIHIGFAPIGQEPRLQVLHIK